MPIVMKQRWRGVTLVELLVSLGITVVMLLMTAVVFKSSTKASGRAMARGEIMHQLRAITRQLDQDFKGLRPDMPLAIIWSAYPDDLDGDGNDDVFGQDTNDDGIDDFFPRQDRIWFFANGDFQTNDYALPDSVLGNVAHIFYGQSLDTFDPPEDASPLMRRILTRREKILTADAGLNWFNNSFYTSPATPTGGELAQDYLPVENTNLSTWKNVDFFLYQNTYFLDQFDRTLSVVRRSQIVDDPVSGAVGLKSFVEGEEGFQRLYVANDVTDFKVEVWFAGAAEWFPNATDIYDFNNNIRTTSQIINFPDDSIAFYWNIQGTPILSTEIEAGSGVYWYSNSEPDIRNMWPNFWPEAIRFTFTLYDKNRRHFPDGETFSYIVKLPKR